MRNHRGSSAELCGPYLTVEPGPYLTVLPDARSAIQTPPSWRVPT